MTINSASLSEKTSLSRAIKEKSRQSGILCANVRARSNNLLGPVEPKTTPYISLINTAGLCYSSHYMTETQNRDVVTKRQVTRRGLENQLAQTHFSVKRSTSNRFQTMMPWASSEKIFKPLVLKITLEDEDSLLSEAIII